MKIYKEMLKDRFYLYRPWIPVCKSIEAGAIRNLGLRAPVLDIGCGNGLFARYCFNDKVDVGLDYDKNAARGACERGVYKKVEIGDARALPFKDETFETVVSVCAVEHMPELDKVLSSVRRVLKKGGNFVFTVPSAEFKEYLFGRAVLRSLGLRRLAERYADNKNRKSGHIHVYGLAEWERILKEAGFDVESIGYLFPKEAVFLWSFLHSLPFKIIFLPFRLCRDLKIDFVDSMLRSIFTGLFSGWIEKRSGIYSSCGGYLLIKASK